jgi:hypothetical protein
VRGYEESVLGRYLFRHVGMQHIDRMRHHFRHHGHDSRNGIGTAVAAALGVGRWGWVEIARAKLLKEGKKDDNYNGVDDALEKPTTPAA